jgi:DNA-binding NtrC family response regulator
VTLELSDMIVERPPKDFYRILVVDDEPVARNVLIAILQESGYTSIDQATTGEEALTIMSGLACHLVLLDKNLPGMDGLQVLKEGKAMRPDTEFIMVTAYGSMDTAIEAMDLGAHSYLTKPLSDIKQIQSRVESTLDKVALQVKNNVLLDRLRMLLSDLNDAEKKLKEVRSPSAGGERVDLSDYAQVKEAIKRLRSLASVLASMRGKAQLDAGAFLDQVGKETANVANLLEGQ